MEPGNDLAETAAYRTCAVGHEESEHGTADQLETVVRGWEFCTRGAAVVEGVAVGQDLNGVEWGWWA